MQTKFYYVRDKKSFPVACIAFNRETPESTDVRFGVSVYHPDDNFDRARARAIAEARMNKSGVVISVDEPKVSSVLKAICALLLKSEETPSRLRKCLRNPVPAPQV